MTSLREAAQQALEALEGYKYVHGAYSNAEAAITALRAALAEQPAEQEPVFWYRPLGGNGLYDGILPNASIELVRKQSGKWLPLYTAPQPAKRSEQEKLAIMQRIVDSNTGFIRNPTTPQPAKREPLTDEELRDALRSCPHDTVENLRVRWLYAKDFARAIERAHGIGEQT